MEKRHEVEYRALISPEIFGRLLDKGSAEFKSSFHGPVTIEDIYFCPKSVNSFSEVEMDDVGSFSLRLRKETADNIDTSTINTKTIVNHGDHNSWVENETRVQSFAECKSILEVIGFKSFFEIKKDRFSFDDGDIHVCLEDIADFQPAIEVEIITSEDNVSRAKDDLLAYLEKNGIQKESIAKKSITNMMMRERAVF